MSRDEAMALAISIYQRDAAGCCLHVVLDDANYHDDFVKVCRDEAASNDHADCVAVADALAAMRPTARRKFAAQLRTKINWSTAGEP